MIIDRVTESIFRTGKKLPKTRVSGVIDGIPVYGSRKHQVGPSFGISHSILYPEGLVQRGTTVGLTRSRVSFTTVLEDYVSSEDLRISLPFPVKKGHGRRIGPGLGEVEAKSTTTIPTPSSPGTL